ncbi:hypothetical protein Zmor_001156 [Zophobas morio]|uniref:PHD-type domain-containing protein n=1 Tax=Zophobas morio TaxID=2755281 RepID=A0AA38J807_9CUCU|nr:hypothetical protein Zmor_001156 [Zophobas morio]
MSVDEPKCSVCNLEFKENEDTVECTGICNIIYHIKCTGLKKSEQKILLDGTKLLWFCDQCRIVGTNVSSLLMSIKSALLSCQDQIVKQNAVITKQNEEISSLNREVADIKTKLIDKEKPANIPPTSSMEVKKPTFTSFFKGDEKKEMELSNFKPWERKGIHNPYNENRDKSTAPVTTPGNFTAIYSSAVVPENNIIVNKNSTFEDRQTKIDVSEENLKWKTVESRSSNSNNTRKGGISRGKSLYGTGKLSSSSNIQGAIRRKWIYVGHISGNTASVQDIADHISEFAEIKNIEIKKLQTKGKNSAFSIGVPTELYDKIYNADVWPESVCLREFNVKSFLVNQRSNNNN